MSRIMLILIITPFIVLIPLSIYCQNKEKVVRMGEVYNLCDSEVKVLETKALRGSGESAFRLSLYYDVYKRDLKEATFWTMIAAENGHRMGEYNYGFRLNEESDPRERMRAEFWLKRAAAKGVKEAKDLLKELKK